MKKKATIQDIADALGMSRNTVSKAINNSEGLAEATRERILQKAVEMGYKQFSYVSALSDNAAFRSSGEERSEAPQYQGEIALLTTLFLTPSHFASLMLDKFQREMAQLGYTLNTHRVTDDDIANGRLPITFSPDRCSGAICFEMFNKAYAEMLCTLDIPVLFVDGPARDSGFILPADQLFMDNTAGIARFVSIMLQRGYRRIGWIGDYRHCQSFYERYIAFRSTMIMAEAEVEERFVIRGKTIDEINWALNGLTDLPDVFICANDFVALDVLRTLSDMGKSVPDDVMLVGFDDSQEARIVTPKLSTVHIHTQIMAFSAMHLMISRIREPSLDFRTVYTEAELILRESTEREGVRQES